MPPSSELIRIVLLALLCGMALPLVVQGIVTMRAIKDAARSIEQDVKESSRALSDILVRLRPDARDTGSVLAGAATSALIAAVRAFHSTSAEAEAAPAPPHKEPTS